MDHQNPRVRKGLTWCGMRTFILFPEQHDFLGRGVRQRHLLGQLGHLGLQPVFFILKVVALLCLAKVQRPPIHHDLLNVVEVLPRSRSLAPQSSFPSILVLVFFIFFFIFFVFIFIFIILELLPLKKKKKSWKERKFHHLTFFSLSPATPFRLEITPQIKWRQIKLISFFGQIFLFL